MLGDRTWGNSLLRGRQQYEFLGGVILVRRFVIQGSHVREQYEGTRVG
jgi:hypothetical protein